METNKKGAGNVSVNECTYFDEDDDDEQSVVEREFVASLSSVMQQR